MKSNNKRVVSSGKNFSFCHNSFNFFPLKIEKKKKKKKKKSGEERECEKEKEGREIGRRGKTCFISCFSRIFIA